MGSKAMRSRPRVCSPGRSQTDRAVAWFRTLVFAAGVILSATAVSANTARTAFIAHTERLRMFVLGQYMDRTGVSPEGIRLLREDMTRQGFYLEGGPEVLDRWIRASPVVGWDSNINGGWPNTSLNLPGITLVTTPEFAAQDGVIVGGNVSAGFRLGYRMGGYLDVDGNVEKVWAPAHGLSRTSGAASACARNHVGGWRFLDLCQEGSFLERDLGRSTAGATSVSFVQLFSGNGSGHELSLTAMRRDVNEDHQQAGRLTVSSVWENVATQVSATLATPAGDAHVQRARLALEVRRMVAGRFFAVELAAEESDGSSFLGHERSDRTYGMSVSTTLMRGLTIGAGYSRTRSSISFFDENRFGVNFRVNALSAFGPVTRMLGPSAPR